MKIKTLGEIQSRGLTEHMYHAIISEDLEDSLRKRRINKPAHLKRLYELEEQNRTLIADPHPAVDREDPSNKGFIGSLIVAKFDSLGDAKQWAKEDPYANAGVYKRITVKPFM